MRASNSSKVTSRTHNRAASNMPRQLFQRIFDSTLPDINVLTKTERVRRTTSEVSNHARNHSSVESTRPYKSHRQETLKAHACTFKNQVFAHHPRITALKERMHQKVIRLVKTDFTSNVIYKSEIKEIKMPIFVHLNSNQHKEDTMSSDDDDHTPKDATISSRPATKAIVAQKKISINWTGENKQFLNKIFEKQQYQDKFEEVNRTLLRNDYLYRCKGINLQVDRQWKY